MVCTWYVCLYYGTISSFINIINITLHHKCVLLNSLRLGQMQVFISVSGEFFYWSISRRIGGCEIEALNLSDHEQIGVSHLCYRWVKLRVILNCFYLCNVLLLSFSECFQNTNWRKKSQYRRQIFFLQRTMFQCLHSYGCIINRTRQRRRTAGKASCWKSNSWPWIWIQSEV